MSTPTMYFEAMSVYDTDIYLPGNAYAAYWPVEKGDYDLGHAQGLIDSPGFSVPQLTVTATFTVDFTEATHTPWTATLANFPPDGELFAIVRFANRNETLVARDAEGRWCWPFDVEPDNAVDLEASPVTISLLPRGGWPPALAEIQIAAGKMAQVA